MASGYQVVVGSRTPKRFAALFPEEAEVTQMPACTLDRVIVVYVVVIVYLPCLHPQGVITVVILNRCLKDNLSLRVSCGGRTESQQTVPFNKS